MGNPALSGRLTVITVREKDFAAEAERKLREIGPHGPSEDYSPARAPGSPFGPVVAEFSDDLVLVAVQTLGLDRRTRRFPPRRSTSKLPSLKDSDGPAATLS